MMDARNARVDVLIRNDWTPRARAERSREASERVLVMTRGGQAACYLCRHRPHVHFSRRQVSRRWMLLAQSVDDAIFAGSLVTGNPSPVASYGDRLDETCPAGSSGSDSTSFLLPYDFMSKFIGG